MQILPLNTRTLALLLAVIGCCLELTQCASVAVDGVPANPVYYKRYHRRRPSPHHDDLDVYEVREVYFVRRTTPKPKAIIRLTDEEMDQRIRCDFDPTLPECIPLSKPRATVPTTTSTTSSTTTTTTTSLPPTTTITTTTTTEESTTSTTDLPILPVLPESEEQTEPSEMEPNDEVEALPTTTPSEDGDFVLDADDGNDDPDIETDAENYDSLEDEQDYADTQSGGSIGGNDDAR